MVLSIPGGVGLVVTLMLTAMTDAPVWPALFFTVLLVVALIRAPFATLETEVANGELRASFRPIGPTKVIPLDAITSHRQVRLPWYRGYGGPEWMSIRRAWHWSSSGRDAIEVHHRSSNGRDKLTFIGTDDITGLDAALRAAASRASTRA